MATKKKMLQAAAGNAGGEALNVEDVFSTYLYTGTGAAQTITNGIDLAGEGGLVWAKIRDTSSTNHMLVDTERGTGNVQRTNFAAADQTGTFLNSFNSNGFTLANNFDMNGSGYDIASWTFRKAPKFFDVVTYTGTGTGATVNHNLGATPACVIIKSLNTSGADDWYTYHVSVGTSGYLMLNQTSGTTSRSNWISVSDSSFTVDALAGQGSTDYVAYLFAHNDGDGGFGPDGDADIIKCGSYTGNGSTDGPEIDLGFEPQWVMIKQSSEAGSWYIVDSMRGISSGNNDALLFANTSDPENTLNNRIYLTPTGFGIEGTTGGGFNDNGQTFIYIAIRRGTKVPESGTEVFDVKDWRSMSGSFVQTGFPVDLSIWNYYPGTGTNSVVNDRLRGVGSLSGSYSSTPFLVTSSTNADNTTQNSTRNYNNEGYDAASGDAVFWSWKRAPNFFDVVAYSGNSTAGRAVDHNLGVAPEMIWMKCRTNTQAWQVYHKDLDANGQGAAASGMGLNLNIGEANVGVWNSTSPTDTSFYLNAEDKSNETGQTYIAYLFASLDGISKVGSYTSDGTNGKVIDCGFTSGARFVLIKGASVATNWLVWDSERGIVAGNDPYLELNTTDAEATNTDYIDPHSSGFIVNSGINFGTNTFIFYAIA